jgi:hypothetical protein
VLQTQAPAVQRKVLEILAADKSNEWTKTDIASEATWADALREKSPEGRVASSKWHYVNLGSDNPDLQKACFGRPALPPLRPASHGLQDNCIIDKIEQFAQELREPETLESERLMALQFLLNLVGDVHDPLNTIERNDQYGRCVAVLPPHGGSPVRFSVYWDEILVAEAAGKDPIKAAGQIMATLSPEEVQKWSGGTPEEWAREAYNVAKTVAYSFPTAGEGKFALPLRKVERDACGAIPLYRLDAGYRDRAIVAIKEQLAKAGLRLAYVLQQNLK